MIRPENGTSEQMDTTDCPLFFIVPDEEESGKRSEVKRVVRQVTTCVESSPVEKTQIRSVDSGLVPQENH